MKTFRVIIASGREFSDYALLCRKCDRILRRVNIKYNIIVVEGEAPGADTLSKDFAKQRGYEIDPYPAEWKIYGKRAGHMRNEVMACNAQALIAFWDGISAGTADMIKRAQAHGLMVRVIIVTHY